MIPLNSAIAPALAPALALALFMLAPESRAQEAEGVEDLDLVELLNVEVSTATKTAERLDEAPAVITVVTQADIQRWGFQSVAASRRS
jgi:outer membrane cobalamin receptor